MGASGVKGSNFIDQLATSVVGARDGGRVHSKDGGGERTPAPIVSVTTQVAISRRVSRFKLQLRDRQEVKSSGGRDDRPTPMSWGLAYDFSRLESKNT